MGVFTYETETTSVIPPARLFKSFVLDSDNLIPEVAPKAIKSIEIIEGNGGPGTIKKICFDEGSPISYIKQKVDEIDQANFSYRYSVIDGDALSDKLEKINCEIKIVASPDGGSIMKSISKDHTIGDHELEEEQIKAGKEMASGLFKAVGDYLLAHPNEY
uniref:Cor a 1.03-like variant-1 n=1 Tax=Corylus avellana TaxID=13451 RepID=A0AA49ENE4_CORAV|nr:Cor a 1.03-like variant-1 [Corylus avellana]